jgi:sRNA-binding protein
MKSIWQQAKRRRKEANRQEALREERKPVEQPSSQFTQLQSGDYLKVTVKQQEGKVRE